MTINKGKEGLRIFKQKNNMRLVPLTERCSIKESKSGKNE